MSNDNIDASTIANVVNGVINALGLQSPSSSGVEWGHHSQVELGRATHVMPLVIW